MFLRIASFVVVAGVLIASLAALALAGGPPRPTAPSVPAPRLVDRFEREWQRRDEAFAPLANKKVVVEGIAFNDGGLRKKCGVDRILFLDHQLTLANCDLRKLGVEGKLVRVHGIVRQAQVSEADQAPGGFLPYVYDLDVLSLEVIPRVTRPFLETPADAQPQSPRRAP